VGWYQVDMRKRDVLDHAGFSTRRSTDKIPVQQVAKWCLLEVPRVAKDRVPRHTEADRSEAFTTPWVVPMIPVVRYLGKGRRSCDHMVASPATRLGGQISAHAIR